MWQNLENHLFKPMCAVVLDEVYKGWSSLMWFLIAVGQLIMIILAVTYKSEWILNFKFPLFEQNYNNLWLKICLFLKTNKQILPAIKIFPGNLNLYYYNKVKYLQQRRMGLIKKVTSQQGEYSRCVTSI